MKTSILVTTISGIVVIAGLIATNSNPDKNRQAEPIILDSAVRSEHIGTIPNTVSPTLSKDKALSDTHTGKERLRRRQELAHTVKKQPASEIKKAFLGNDPVDDLEQAFYQDELQDIEKAIDIAAQCVECIPRLKEILEQESADNQLRFYAAQALIKSGDGEAAMLVLKEIMNANSLELPELEDGLKQAFVQLDSVEAVNTLITVLLDEQALDSDAPIPDDIEYMVSKVIINMSDRQDVAYNLAQEYHNASTPEEKERLLTIGHPEMNALLVVDAYKENNVEQANKLYNRLVKLDDPAVIDGMMLIAKNQDMFPLEDIAGYTYDWVSEHKNDTTLSMLVNYISDFDSTSEERVIAAYGIAATREDDKTITALMKAWEHLEAPIVKDHLNALATMPELFSGKSKGVN